MAFMRCECGAAETLARFAIVGYGQRDGMRCVPKQTNLERADGQAASFWDCSRKGTKVQAAVIQDIG
jgi:hypothetical protein